MKKIIFLVVMLVSIATFAAGEPNLEVVGNLVKATYYYDNGKIQQVGFFKDGKLEGKWISYSENGNVQTIAEYSNGEKVGNWKNYENAIVETQVTYNANQVASVKVSNLNTIADKN